MVKLLGTGVCSAVHLRSRVDGILLSSAAWAATAAPSSTAQCAGDLVFTWSLRSTFWSDVLEWLAQYAEHEPDWAAAAIAVLSGHDKRLEKWTYDREFRTTWRRPDGTAIPLAIRP